MMMIVVDSYSYYLVLPYYLHGRQIRRHSQQTRLFAAMAASAEHSTARALYLHCCIVGEGSSKKDDRGIQCLAQRAPGHGRGHRTRRQHAPQCQSHDG